jgi:uncharacterized membrane protein YphA (DoxX/SURF4 family)
MPNWLKTAGKWGSIFIISGLGVLMVTLMFNPEFGSEFAIQADGKWGSIFAILALVITLLKQIIAFIGFLTAAIKVIVILFFVAIFIGVGLLILRTWNSSRNKDV